MTEHAAVRLLALPATALLATCGGASAPDAEPADLAIVDAIKVALGTDIGTLTSGMSADLIVLDADPLADIRNTLQIDRVMLRGEWVGRDGLLPAP